MTSYRRMRRQARQIRRSGMQPMMFINGDPGQFPAPVGVMLARFAWRYRSELAPLGVAAMTLLAACWTHAALAKWWAVILAGSSVAAWLIAFLARGSDSRPLRNASTRPRPSSWPADGSPWPRSWDRSRHRFREPWQSARWFWRCRGGRTDAGARRCAWNASSRPGRTSRGRSASSAPRSCPPPSMCGDGAQGSGSARGQTITDVTARIPAIESGLGTFRGAVRIYPTPDDLANRFELRVLDIDPHADAIPWPGPSVRSITEPIELGPFEDASPCRVLFLRRHALFAGTTGSGKSGGLNVLMANLTACRDVVIWAIDLKKGMELGPWQECIDRLATTPEQAATLLRDAVAILEARAAYLAAHGRRTWEPSPDMPALVIIIDEYAELAEQAPDAMDDTDSIARLGRAVAVTLIAATQRPTQKAMGQGAVRSQMDMRICFRVREPRDVDLVLGQGMLHGRMECAQAQRARQIPDLRARARHPAP